MTQAWRSELSEFDLTIDNEAQSLEAFPLVQGWRRHAYMLTQRCATDGLGMVTPAQADRDIHVGQYDYEVFATLPDSTLVTECDRRVWVGCHTRVRPVQS